MSRGSCFIYKKSLPILKNMPTVLTTFEQDYKVQGATLHSLQRFWLSVMCLDFAVNSYQVTKYHSAKTSPPSKQLLLLILFACNVMSAP